MSKTVKSVQFLQPLVVLHPYTGNHRPVPEIVLPDEGDAKHHQDWRGWSIRVEGASVIITPADKANYQPLDVEIEVPRAACAVTWKLDRAPVAAKDEKAARK